MRCTETFKEENVMIKYFETGHQKGEWNVKKSRLGLKAREKIGIVLA